MTETEKEILETVDKFKKEFCAKCKETPFMINGIASCCDCRVDDFEEQLMRRIKYYFASR